ncbi:M23 family metallopeptidase [Paenibacillus albidus]|uniref:M23 family metallopeptidase n=1 Tax=Paenibacillus albidus TaxID=2041023 RepID=UPI002034DF9F|nr:M23 family metallopeptidase [Paenibacillus albidus]
MKNRPDHNKITLLVVREAGRPVRQLHLSKPLALALPAAAALSISSLVTSMHFHASQSISQLEAEAAALTLSNLRMEMQVADKDEALLRLRSQVTELSEEAEGIKDQLKNVSELEEQLQSLIDKGKSSSSGTAADAVSNTSAPPQVGGEYIAVHQQDPFQMVEQTRDELQEIRSLLDEMVHSISKTITEAQAVNTAQAKVQAQQARARQAKLDSVAEWPTQSRMISSSFGYRTDPFKGSSAFHSGIDIAAPSGDPVYAALGGTVLAVDQQGARGKYIVIEHPGGLETWYMHLSGMNVTAGEKVRKGQNIGQIGSTGRSTGPHLHFQVVKHNKPVNPLAYVKP